METNNYLRGKMIPLWTVILLCICNISKIQAQKEESQWHNTLKPQGVSASFLTLAKDGKSDYVIVTNNNPSTQDQKAAGELQYWLKQMTGAELVIHKESDFKSNKSNIISIGETGLLKNASFSSAKTDLQDEGYGIAVEGTKLFLWGGRTRGAINAVFALLEEDLGCRWYSDECIKIPKSRVLKFAPVSRVYKPIFRYRDPYWFVAKNADWALRNRTNASWANIPEEWGGRFDGFGNHTFYMIAPPDEYFKDHPEYFMLDENDQRNKNQLCTTNPDVIRLAKEWVREQIKKSPHTDMFSVAKNDISVSCLCPECKALAEAEGTNMGPLMYMVNAVAEDIEKDYPNILISTLAYLETIDVPKTILPRKNVAIWLCNDIVGMWLRPFDPAEICDFGRYINDWAKVCKRLFIWDYSQNFSHYLAPYPNMDFIADNTKFYSKNNVEGVMFQNNYHTAGSERDWQRSWVTAKLLWDPSLKLDDLMDDFIYGYYGKAAPAIAEYNKLLQGQKEIYKIEISGPWLAKHYNPARFGMDHPYLSKDFLFRATKLYEKAESLSENEQVLNRVKRDKLPVLYVRLVRGPDLVGQEYGKILDEFEIIAEKVGVTHLEEVRAGDLDKKIEEWRKQWNEYSKTNNTTLN